MDILNTMGEKFARLVQTPFHAHLLSSGVVLALDKFGGKFGGQIDMEHLRQE